MRTVRTLLLLSAVCAAFTACSTATKEKWGLSKSAPSEYMVAPRAPLSLPPEYDLLPVGVENYYQNDAEDEDLAEADQNLLAKISKSGTAGAAAN